MTTTIASSEVIASIRENLQRLVDIAKTKGLAGVPREDVETLCRDANAHISELPQDLKESLSKVFFLVTGENKKQFFAIDL